METAEQLSASMEDYLQAIYHIQSEKQAARTKDIALRMKVNNSSVTGALRSLSEKGFLNYAPYDVITLTGKGVDYAEDVVRRHNALKRFFTEILGVDEPEADTSACKMEHTVSPMIVDRIIRFIDFIQICPRGGEDWLEKFCLSDSEETDPEKCSACISRVRRNLFNRGTSA
ncbi:MAG: metal-dependent transcriptional regulator [Thermodesulfobacteriota bacterium]